MTLFEIVRKFENLALAAPNVRTAADGNVYDAMNDSPKLKYGVFFVSQDTHQEFEQMDRYGLTLFYIDRLDDTLEDNRLQIQSIGKEILSTVIRDFCEEYDVDLPTMNYIPFTEKFKDLTAGIYVQITIEVYKDDCYDDFSEVKSVYQTKVVDIYHNGEYSIQPDKDYTALKEVIVNVNVECSGCTPEQLEEAYQSGRTDQKNLLSTTAFTENGSYTSENGWSGITVNVPSTGYTQEDLDAAYQSGYTDGYKDGSSQTGKTDYSTQYLTIEAEVDNYMLLQKAYYDEVRPFYYKINDSEWIYKEDWEGRIELSAGDKLYLKGNNNSYGSYDGAIGGCSISTYDSNDRPYKIYGNVMSLIYGDNFVNKLNFPVGSEYNFANLFASGLIDNFSTIDAENLVLPVTALTNCCYWAMFGGCKKLTQAPELPATTLAERCYESMFRNCTSLTSIPANYLPATTLAERCYEYMFLDCSKLDYIKCLATDISATNCTTGWVSGVANSGIFVTPSTTSWPTGNNGIPSGWTIVNV